MALRGMVSLALLAMLVAQPAWAHKTGPCSDIDGLWRVIGTDNAHSSNRCIGNPHTPSCAVETYLAAHWRGDMKMGLTVGLPGDFESPVSSVEPGLVWRYAIKSCQVLTRHDRPLSGSGFVKPRSNEKRKSARNYREEDDGWYPGDILLDVRAVTCRPGEEGCDTLEALQSPPPKIYHNVFPPRSFIIYQGFNKKWRCAEWSFLGTWPIEGKVEAPCQQRDARWHRVSDTSSTSHCVGDARTPMCAIDTWLAAWFRGDQRLLDMVDPGRTVSKEGKKHDVDHYKVIDCKFMKEDDTIIYKRGLYEWVNERLHNSYDGRDYDGQKGDVRIGIRDKSCAYERGACNMLEYDIQLVLRKSNGKWSIVYQYSE